MCKLCKTAVNALKLTYMFNLYAKTSDMVDQSAARAMIRIPTPR